MTRFRPTIIDGNDLSTWDGLNGPDGIAVMPGEVIEPTTASVHSAGRQEGDLTMHPQDRDQRRNLHRLYDGERQLIRDMQAAYHRMRQLDQQALDSEWDHLTTFSVAGSLIAIKAQDYLASLA